MPSTNHLSRLTPEERRRRLAALLATGLVRLGASLLPPTAPVTPSFVISSQPFPRLHLRGRRLGRSKMDGVAAAGPSRTGDEAPPGFRFRRGPPRPTDGAFSEIASGDPVESHSDGIKNQIGVNALTRGGEPRRGTSCKAGVDGASSQRVYLELRAAFAMSEDGHRELCEVVRAGVARRDSIPPPASDFVLVRDDRSGASSPKSSVRIRPNIDLTNLRAAPSKRVYLELVLRHEPNGSQFTNALLALIPVRKSSAPNGLRRFRPTETVSDACLFAPTCRKHVHASGTAENRPLVGSHRTDFASCR
jgi:hypothetical protein